jgi:hypothetical protein
MKDLPEKIKELIGLKESNSTEIKIPWKSQIDKFLLLHKKKIQSAIKVSDAIIQFKEFKTPVVFAKSAFGFLIEKTESCYDGEEFFTSAMKWNSLLINSRCLYYFKDIIFDYPFENIAGSRQDQRIKIYKFPFGSIGMVENDAYMDFKAYIPPGSSNKIDKDFVLEFLSSEKSQKLGTNCISFKSKEFFPEEMVSIPSRRCDHYTSYLSKYLEKNINRSVLWCGPPGTGKTTLAQSILSKLNYKVLKIRINDLNQASITDYACFIKGFKFDAVLIDDIDHNLHNEQLLEYMEFFNRHVKLVFGTVNSLVKLNQALIRPGRFDEIVKIEHLENDDTAMLLGDLSKKYLDKVQYWPVAYLNELIFRSKIQNPIELDVSFKELNSRVDGNFDNFGLQNKKTKSNKKLTKSIEQIDDPEIEISDDDILYEMTYKESPEEELIEDATFRPMIVEAGTIVDVHILHPRDFSTEIIVPGSIINTDAGHKISFYFDGIDRITHLVSYLIDTNSENYYAFYVKNDICRYWITFRN